MEHLFQCLDSEGYMRAEDAKTPPLTPPPISSSKQNLPAHEPDKKQQEDTKYNNKEVCLLPNNVDSSVALYLG